MMKRLCRFSVLFVFTQITLAQNVGINPGGSAPNTSSILDLNTGNTFTSPNGKGLIIPNVALTATSDAVTVNTPFTSLLVYNTATAGAGATAVTPGFYYWNGAKWVAFGGNGGKDWSLTGNAGTTVGTNFLGTTDNVDLQFNVNSVRSGLIDIAYYQTFLGYRAGLNTTTAGILNTFIGYESGKTNTSGTGNTAIGYNSIQANSTGTDNSAIGVQTLYYTTGSSNVALGTNAGFSVNSGSGNTALGFWAMNNLGNSVISGSNNTSVGNQAGSTLTTGSYNSHLGYLSGMAAGTYTNSTAIGSYAQTGASDALILGSISGVNGAANSAKVGIGINNPTEALHVVVPSGSSINAITADVTAGNATGNAIYAVSVGIPNYSSIYTVSSPTVAGTGFTTATSNHTLLAAVNNNQAYSFALYGRVVGSGTPSGGVMGYWGANIWGTLGYKTTGANTYGGYFNGSAGTGNSSTGLGKEINPNLPGLFIQNVGMGAIGDLMGGWAKGSVYGMAVKGERFSLYVDGKTIVNQPIVQLSKSADNKTIVNYTPASVTADLQLHGVTKLENGAAKIELDAQTLGQFESVADLAIIVTPAGQTNGVYAEIRSGKLVITENSNGKANVKVSWMIIGKRKLPENFVPEEVKDKDFNSNLNGLMKNENDPAVKPEGIWWDGSKLNKGTIPQ